MRLGNIMIFFTSDQHFQHANIIQYCDRPFSSVEEMNLELIQRHNSVVRPQDVVFHLGDFCFGNRDNIPKFLAKLNGIHHLTVGNHDHAWNPRKYSRYLKYGFSTVCKSRQLDLTDFGFPRIITLCHLPPDIGDTSLSVFDRGFVKHQLKPNNTLFLFGHTHQKSPEFSADSIHVGVDSWNYTPVSLIQLLDYCKFNKLV